MTAPTLALPLPSVDFEVTYKLGYSTGYGIGFAHGADDAFDRVQSVLTGVASTWRSPRQAELAAVRDEVLTTPCRTTCNRCSRCVRFSQWFRNGRRDFTGGRVATW